MVDFNLYLKDSEVEVLNTIAEAAGETVDTWIRITVIEGLQSDIEHYFGRSKTITEKLNKKLDQIREID
jgi:hypothetical protein